MKKLNDVLAVLDAARTRQENIARQQAAERSKQNKQAEAIQATIDKFLEECCAIPCPPEAYAAWLITWITQGGAVTQASNSNFAAHGWMLPTRSTSQRIPTAYGAQALHLLVVDAMVDVPDVATSRDSRNGWEWGHGTVLRITPIARGVVATTNDTDIVRTYPDIEQLIRSMSPDQLAERVRLALEAGARGEIGS